MSKSSLKYKSDLFEFIFFLISLFLFIACTNNEPILEQAQLRSLKRGVPYSFSIIDDAKLLSPGVSWFYNWAPDVNAAINTATTENNIDFIPMAWNGNFDASRIGTFNFVHGNRVLEVHQIK